MKSVGIVMKLAVIMTVFNRKDKTISCLSSLSQQKNMPDYEVFMCDDGSTDGTSEEVLQRFENVKTVYGNGHLFWTKGMAKAMEAAVTADGYDYYLMINDDVEFLDSMWQTMFTPFINHSQIGVTGCTKSRSSGELTYGGAKFYHSNGKRYVGEKIVPDNKEYKECDVANWNCFLISKDVVSVVGLIDSVYEHSFGDFDYTLRMREAGIPVYVSNEYVGYCENNTVENTYKDCCLTRKDRMKKFLSPNGLPLKSWGTFSFRYYGSHAIRNFIGPYVKFALSLITGKEGI